jgi:hypothetical protein
MVGYESFMHRALLKYCSREYAGKDEEGNTTGNRTAHSIS